MNKLFAILFLISSSTFATKQSIELEQAKEAAPAHITKDASYMVWQKNHFELVVKGTGEFVCLVLHDPQGRYEPSCLNQAAMKAVFPVYEFQTKQLYQGVAFEKILEEIKKFGGTERFPKPEPGALVYMMSPKNKFYDPFGKKLLDIAPHVMLYYPKIKAESLGFNNQDGLPMFYDEYPHLSVIHIHTSTGNHSH